METRSDLDINDCLAELREMFPKHHLSLSTEGRIVLGMGLTMEGIEQVSRIRIASATYNDAMLPVEIEGDSLADALEKVRQYHAPLPASPNEDKGAAPRIYSTDEEALAIDEDDD